MRKPAKVVFSLDDYMRSGILSPRQHQSLLGAIASHANILMATIHANNTAAMLDRICQLIEEVVYPAPRLLVAQTINVCVHIRRDKAHAAGRSLSGIDRVVGADDSGRWLLEPLETSWQ